ncbi:MAG: hypothetical protein NWS43_06965 [Crocinitomicaceae bacterium]|jgi:hypothetical protein|nr:hypothetical protein [Crocinitomicaceae bacterium]
MKKILFLALPLALGFSSCNVAGEEDYANLSNDMCDCMNQSTTQVSATTKEAIIDAMNTGKSMDDAMMELAEKDPMQTMADGQHLIEAGPKFEKCFASMEKKYDDLYTTAEESEIMNRLLETLKKNESCEWTSALVQMGIQAEKK